MPNYRPIFLPIESEHETSQKVAQINYLTGHDKLFNPCPYISFLGNFQTSTHHFSGLFRCPVIHEQIPFYLETRQKWIRCPSLQSEQLLLQHYTLEWNDLICKGAISMYCTYCKTVMRSFIKRIKNFQDIFIYIYLFVWNGINDQTIVNISLITINIWEQGYLIISMFACWPIN